MPCFPRHTLSLSLLCNRINKVKLSLLVYTGSVHNLSRLRRPVDRTYMTHDFKLAFTRPGLSARSDTA